MSHFIHIAPKPRKVYGFRAGWSEAQCVQESLALSAVWGSALCCEVYQAEVNHSFALAAAFVCVEEALITWGTDGLVCEDTAA